MYIYIYIYMRSCVFCKRSLEKKKDIGKKIFNKSYNFMSYFFIFYTMFVAYLYKRVFFKILKKQYY